MMQAEPYLIALVVLAAPLVGCIADGDAGASGPMDIQPIAEGDQSHITDRRTEAVRDADAWQQLWNEHAVEDPGDGTAVEPPTSVDFSRRMILAAFMGQQPSTCHDVEIENATETANGTVRVEGAWRTIETGVCAQQLTAPFEIVSVPAHEAPVVFEMRNETVSPDSEGDEEDGLDGEGPPDNKTASFETIDQGTLSGIENETQRVVRDASAWQALWANHTREGDDRSAPGVDFEERTVIALFMGERPSTCHAVEVNRTVENGSDLVVNATYITQGDGVACGMQMTYPFHIVSVPHVDGEVTFEFTTRTR